MRLGKGPSRLLLDKNLKIINQPNISNFESKFSLQSDCFINIQLIDIGKVAECSRDWTSQTIPIQASVQKKNGIN